MASHAASTTSNTAAPSQHAEEGTFRNFTTAEGTNYAASRGSYTPQLYQIIADHHKATGGSFDLLLDIGCGPGNSTRPMAPYFKEAVGVDTSQGMIDSANKLGGKTGEAGDGPDIKFVVGKAEEFDRIPGLLDEGSGKGKVDLLIAAMAAHWFDIAPFWRSATKVVKKGGTVALWTGSSFFCHPTKTPNAEKVQEVLYWLELDMLGPFHAPGSWITRGYYDNLGMPWDAGTDLGEEFKKQDFKKMEWDRDRKMSGDDFFLAHPPATAEEMGNGMTTASSVVRWRDAHPDLVGTDRDVIAQTVKKLEEAVGGKDTRVLWGVGVALLLFKRT